MLVAIESYMPLELISAIPAAHLSRQPIFFIGPSFSISTCNESKILMLLSWTRASKGPKGVSISCS